jgi:pSer/pThr/pTyr-binding forkhead associated (FHA) protein
MDVRLLVAHAKADAKQIALGRETLIGRSPECNLRIASGQISRKHCVIKVADALVTVRDLGSANGTRLNGQTITAEVDMPIPPGSTLVVGPLKFIVQFSPPRLDEDTELLSRSALAENSELKELQRMATAPVVDGEETKDYPPSRTRKRGVAPPLVVKDEAEQEAAARGAEARPAPGRTTEADFSAIPNETVFDNFLDDIGPEGIRQIREGGNGDRPRVGGETDFVFEEDDLRQLAEAIEGGLDETPAVETPANFEIPAEPPAASEETILQEPVQRKSGWRLLDMLRRKKKPVPPKSSSSPDPEFPGPEFRGPEFPAPEAPSSSSPGPAPDDDADDPLTSFLKDQ